MSICSSTSRRTRRAALWLALLLSGARSAVAADRPPLIASRGDAFVAHQNGSDVWSIGSANLELVVGFDASRTLTLQQLFNPVTGRAWDITPGADVSLSAGGDRITLTSTGAVTLASAIAQSTENGVTLTFTFESRAQRLLLSRVYACYSGSPTIEAWTRIAGTGGDGTPVADLVLSQMTMPLGRIRWLGGLRGDSAGGDDTGAFELAERNLEPGERIVLYAEGRSTEQFVPLMLIDDGREQFYSGLMWSGAWRIAAERENERIHLSTYFPGVGTTVTAGRPLELPHTFFGVTGRDVNEQSDAMRQFILRGIRGGRPFEPLVTYNSWFIYGTAINEDLMVAEIDRAAALGVELFVLDAGWYLGAGASHDYDFESGLGTWTVDEDRFPSGLTSLTDYAHGAGMRFGLWVEPERAALATVGEPGFARESWLATRDGDYGAAVAPQICLVHPEARQWVLDHLVALIDRVRPDYLKWDNNFWINCDRSGHEHGAADGNLQHVQALYGILGELRRRYPDMLIENVSGGGNRLDFGMLAYTDTAWMDDRTSPSSHVRHNLEGLTVAFPPAYLLSFLIDAEGEPVAGSDDLALAMRSRMPGIFGITYRTELMDDDTAAALAFEIQQYKTYRDIIAQSNAALLSEQAPVDEDSWDVLQEVTDDKRSALIFAFKGDGQEGRLIVRPRGLLADATYDVSSLDLGPIGSSRGDLLMQDGVEVVHNIGSRAHILILRARE